MFRSTQSNLKEIEHCYNELRQYECPLFSMYYEDKPRIRHKVNENSASQLISLQSVIFEVDMADFQSKIMTYRAALKQNQVISRQNQYKIF